MNLGLGLVAVPFPRRNFLGHFAGVVDAATETLAAEDANLDLGHVKPTGVLWRMVKFQSIQEPSSLRRWKRFVQGSARVGVEVVRDQADAPRLPVVNVHEFLNACRPIPFGASFGHLDVTPAAQRFATHEQIADSLALVFVIHALRVSRSNRQRLLDFADQLLAGFIHADHGKVRVVRQLVRLQDILHVPYEVRAGFRRNAPRLHLTQVDVFF